MVFTAIFTVEAFIRIIAIGPMNYFLDGWNIFDLIVAVGSITGIFISKSTEVEIFNTSIFRAFRILRLLRLLRRGGSSLRNIFNTFVITMQSLANIGSLLVLFMYMYSVVGMIYLGEVKRNGSMNDYITFESFTSAFITLFTIATGDSWNYTIASFTFGKAPNNDCITDPSYQDYANAGYQTIGCGDFTFAFAYFVSFFLIVNLVFLKLFIAIIIGGYRKTEI
jgi:Ion transport protein